MPSNILFYATIVSALGLAIIFLGDLVVLRKSFTKKEIVEKIPESKPVFHDVREKIYLPAVKLAKTAIMPKIFREIEIIISKTRLLFLKAERFLFGLTHYVRGKREINSGGTSAHPYWDRLNGNKKEEEKEEEKEEVEEEK